MSPAGRRRGSGRRAACLVGLLLALAARGELTAAGGLAIELDDAGRIVGLTVAERPAPLSRPLGWEVIDEAEARSEEAFVLGFDELWTEGNEWGFTGPLWRLGDGWERVENLLDDQPGARLNLRERADSDGLRLIFPVLPDAALSFRLPLRARGLSGRIRLGLVPLNDLGQATGRWQPFDVPQMTATGAPVEATCLVTPPPATALIQVWVGLEEAVGNLEVGPLMVTVHAGGQRVELVGDTTPAAGGFAREATGEGLRLSCRWREAGEALRLEARLTAIEPRPRALTLRCHIPLDAGGWSWWEDTDQSLPIAADSRRRYATWLPLGDGHLISPYPLACVTRPAPAQGLALAAPLAQPVLTRFAYRAEQGLTASFELGLDPSVGQTEARVELALFAVDAEWGLRAALDRFYGLWPDDVRAGATRAGAWFGGANPNDLPDPRRYGLLFDEDATGRLAWARRHELACLTTLQPWGVFCRPAAGGPVTADGLYPAATVAFEPAFEAAAPLDAEGRPHRLSLSDGTVFIPQSALPGLPDGPAAAAQAILASRLQGADGRPLHGVCLDGIGAEWAGWQLDDYRPSHLAAAAGPLSHSPRTGRPVVYTGLGQTELIRTLSRRLRARGQLVLGHLDPTAPLPWVAPWLDVLGGGERRPIASHLRWLRAVGYQKPLTYLDPGLLDPRALLADQNRRWQTAILYGAFPGTVGWLGARNLAVYGGLFDVYVPLLRQLAAAGWEPVPHARVNDAAIRLERYGFRDNLHLVLQNPTELARVVTLTIDPLPLGLITTAADGTEERRLVFLNRLSRDKRAIEFRVALDRWQVTFAMPPWSLQVLTPYKVDAGFEDWLGLDALTGGEALLGPSPD